ncbi:MAG: tetratricopeptide repeat protein [Candidatus Obscuribacterales bacterium]|nr:tetratricopeptide repeat protein [Candidatus Obscuribacterales bacterium]
MNRSGRKFAIELPHFDGVRRSGGRRFLPGISLVLALLVTGSAAASSSTPESRWAEMQRRGTDALDSNRYWIAEPLLKKCVTEGEKFGCDNWRLATSLGELGRLYTIRSRFAEAEPLLERELYVKELSFGRSDGKIIPSMGSLIKFYLAFGTAAKADALTEDMLALVEGKMSEPRNQAKPVRQKGEPLTGWLGEAAPTARDPLMEWAITCDAVGNAYRSRGEFKLSEKCFRAALEMKTTILGTKHLSLANSYDSLAAIYVMKNDEKEAEDFYRDAYAITCAILPRDSPEVYARLDRLARCLVKQGKYSEAEELYLSTLNIRRTELSKHGDEARARFALGSLYVEQKKYAQAAAMLRQALHMAESFNGPYQIGIVPYLEKYAYALYHLGRMGEVARLRGRARTIAGA